ncbi:MULTISPECIES: hypothetical protein [Halomonas]|uniref:Uncharacterized protein n=1 Tax=Halomonas halophila TaxID=29573 RepID=A0ABQ0U272_9GAMM|nr:MULTISPECIES: hypothetical protein [Halomonas]MDR5890523.1 hypothetical protein [Halomonas salina]WJY08277.1 hypothetical protein QWG60_05035 [Halomonas halophila]GEK72637.1 hypothetical protein HHA04nite_11810 [Halomonas halophila]
MRKLLQTISIAMPVLTVLFPVLYLVDAMGETAMKWAMLVVTVVWFAVTPLWMGREDHAAAAGAPTAE